MAKKTFSSFPFTQTEEEKRMTSLYKESIQTEKRMTPKEIEKPEEEKKMISAYQSILESLLVVPEFEVFKQEEVDIIHNYLLSDMPIVSLFERFEGRPESPFSIPDLRYCWDRISSNFEMLDSTRNRFRNYKTKQQEILDKTKQTEEIIEELKEMDFF